MSENFSIHGIVGDYAEAGNADAFALVSTFFTEVLEFKFDPDEIITVHWLGQYMKERHRSLIVKVKPKLKSKILQNTPKLARKVNENGRPYSVNVQLPEMLAEQKREIRQIIKEKKHSEKDLDEALKSKILVRNNNVYINGQLQRKWLKPPTILQIFDISPEDHAKMKQIFGDYNIWMILELHL